MIRRPPRSTQGVSSAASDVYKRQMNMQAEAERKKRAAILRSEGERQAAINVAEGEKVMKSLIAEGKAEAMIKIYDANANALKQIANAMMSPKGNTAASFMIAERYIDSYKHMGKKSNSLIVDTSPIDVSDNIAKALEILQKGMEIAKPCLDSPK
eukprot:TRINITY_DN1176_c0_g1_i6.p1 TRINITY_DN1176_c0_g1~~TRINITY_DN1176_c0_g1_i6.p1  ORF type:complete len:155 (-),score=41.66 TRINITY_DN1176_c0_g1_i6:111-575(-)